MPPLKIAIIGSGISGLSTALSISLLHQHHTITIYESHSSLSELGAGIQMYPNATRIFRHWNLLAQFRAIANLPSAMRITRWANDAIIADLPLNPSAGWEYDDLPILQVARPDLQKVLAKACAEVDEHSRAKIVFGKAVERVDVESGTVRFEDGDEGIFDLVIAADGIRSRSRASIPETASLHARASSEYWIRAVIERETMLAAGADMAALMEPHQETIAWAGPGITILTYPISGATKYNIVIMVQGRADATQVGKWSQEGDLEEVAEILAPFNERVRKLWSLVTSCKKWTIGDLPRLPSYTSANGKMILIGDAAHAIVPHAGAGGAMAIEDGAALAEFIKYIDSPSQLPLFMKEWSTLRQTRVENVRRSANDSVTWLSTPDGPEQQKRDAMWAAMTKGMKQMTDKLGEEGMKNLPKAKQNPDGNDMQDAGWRRYLYAYDAKEEAELVVRRLRDVTVAADDESKIESVSEKVLEVPVAV